MLTHQLCFVIIVIYKDERLNCPFENGHIFLDEYKV